MILFILFRLFARLLLHMQPLWFFAMSKSILAYFKPVGNRNEEQQVKLPDLTGPLAEELLSSVILVHAQNKMCCAMFLVVF